MLAPAKLVLPRKNAPWSSGYHSGDCDFVLLDGKFVIGFSGELPFARRMTTKDKPSPSRSLKGFRLAVAAAIALAVLCISLYVAWHNAIDAEAARFEQYYTQQELKSLSTAISKYQNRFGKSPHSIEELGTTNEDSSVSRAQVWGDGWHRRFILNVSETNTVAISYGRDGKPGGIGLDCDLSSTNWAPPESRPTFPQFLYDMPTGGMIKTSIACGVLTFFLAVFTIKVPALTRPAISYFALKILLVTLAASLVATIITALHIPSGH